MKTAHLVTDPSIRSGLINVKTKSSKTKQKTLWLIILKDFK